MENKSIETIFRILLVVMGTYLIIHEHTIIGIFMIINGLLYEEKK